MTHIIMSDKNLQYARRFYNNEINSNDYDFIKSNRMHAKLLKGSDATLITYSVKGCDLSDTEIEEISALGMYPSKQYNGENEANGYIVVKEDGELVCYHFYDMGMVRRHLLENTKFDTPASSKMVKDKEGKPKGFQRKPYCVLYRNEEGELEIKLNFQIRWA